MNIICAAQPQLAANTQQALETCPTGVLILNQCPGATVALIPVGGEARTCFEGKREGLLEIRVSELHQNGLNSQPPAAVNTDWAESVSCLAHELIHAIHREESKEDYRMRNTTGTTTPGFPNQEEELTITGNMNGVFRSTLCENSIRLELGLQPRRSHGAIGQ